MSESWIAFEYDHEEKRWTPSDSVRRVYHCVGHIRSALSNGSLHWEICREAPDLIECELVHYLVNPALPRDERGRQRYERHVSTGPKLVFVEVASKLNGDVFPRPPRLPDQSNIS